MSRIEDKATALFNRSSENDFIEAFEVKETIQVTANFRKEFVAAPLLEKERTAIQDLIYGTNIPNENNAVSDDYNKLSTLTQQIRAIERESILLHGERIQKARDILIKYQEGSFTKWLLIAYRNRQTPYRILHFYELFQKLEKEDRPLFEKMPKKAAYSLAMRKGDLTKKLEIIRDLNLKTPKKIEEEIQKAFPLPENDRRANKKNKDDIIVKHFEDVMQKIIQEMDHLSDAAREKIMTLAQKILKKFNQIE